MLNDGLNYRQIGEVSRTSTTTAMRRVQALEQEIGLDLTRPSKGDMRLVELTEAGAAVAEKAKVAIAALDDVMSTVESLKP